ncbi:hypothetical protein KP509_17G081200 [Ceratopteris richardii]|nr:hypothetical protein KP509_17G081200 [Ceratopteris richardii]
MAEFLSVRFEKSLQLQPGKCFVGPSTFYVDYSDVIVPNESSLHGRDVTAEQLHIPFLAVGNGFMVWDNQHSKHVKWTPVHCSNCASLLGSYPYTCTDSGFSREGLHLFRCQVIPCKGDGTLFDTYRYETFKSLLVKELRKRTDENASHRFLVQSLISGLPFLQLIILNYDALICTGRVFGDMEDWSCYTKTSGSLPSAIELQKCIKVLFVDCTSFSEDDRRQTELWAKEHDAEAFFMLEDFMEKLRDELSVNSLFYHAESDGLFHSFQCSFIQGE